MVIKSSSQIYCCHEREALSKAYNYYQLQVDIRPIPNPSNVLYRGTSLIRNSPTPLGSPQVPRHRATIGFYGGGGVLMSEVPL